MAVGHVIGVVAFTPSFLTRKCLGISLRQKKTGHNNYGGQWVFGLMHLFRDSSTALYFPSMGLAIPFKHPSLIHLCGWTSSEHMDQIKILSIQVDTSKTVYFFYFKLWLHWQTLLIKAKRHVKLNVFVDPVTCFIQVNPSWTLTYQFLLSLLLPTVLKTYVYYFNY